MVSGVFPTVVSPNPEETAAMEMATKRAAEIDADVVMASDPDSDRIGVAGNSAGGHLAALLGVTPERKYFGELTGPPEPSAAVQSVVTLSGVVDMAGLYPRDRFSLCHFKLILRFRNLPYNQKLKGNKISLNL